MTQKAAFFHAGCPARIGAENRFEHTLDPGAFSVEIVHPGGTPLPIDSSAKPADVKGAMS